MDIKKLIVIAAVLLMPLAATQAQGTAAPAPVNQEVEYARKATASLKAAQQELYKPAASLNRVLLGDAIRDGLRAAMIAEQVSKLRAMEAPIVKNHNPVADAMKAKIRKPPLAVVKEIIKAAEKEYPNDLKNQEFEVESQMEAWGDLNEYRTDGIDGVPKDTVLQAIAKEEAQWPGNYAFMASGVRAAVGKK